MNQTTLDICMEILHHQNICNVRRSKHQIEFRSCDSISSLKHPSILHTHTLIQAFRPMQSHKDSHCISPLYTVLAIERRSPSSCQNLGDTIPFRHYSFSIVELPVLVLTEECDPDGRQSLRLEKPQTLLEGVVDVDPSAGTNDHGATSTTRC